jgi:tetratricopeptide (TPR) repeat protein
VQRNQKYLIVGALALLITILVIGKEVNPNKKINTPATTTSSQDNHDHKELSFNQILNKSKESISATQTQKLALLENLASQTGDAQLHSLHQLAKFWRDSAKIFAPYAFYNAEIAKLENSEKSLTFAAQQFIDELLINSDPTYQHWLAGEAEVLLNKILSINPKNDSATIALGACYMLGGLHNNNPMQFILPVREIANKNANNLYAQQILGLGGRKSGQYDKAIERFLIIAKAQPDNIGATINLAECYELSNKKTEAIEWYKKTKALLKDDAIKKEIDKRIVALQ